MEAVCKVYLPKIYNQFIFSDPSMEITKTHWAVVGVPLIPVLRRQRPADLCEFKASLGYKCNSRIGSKVTEKPCLEKPKNEKRKRRRRRRRNHQNPDTKALIFKVCPPKKIFCTMWLTEADRLETSTLYQEHCQYPQELIAPNPQDNLTQTCPLTHLMQQMIICERG